MGKTVFISYAHVDQERVHLLERALCALGLHVTYDRNDVRVGEPISMAIRDLINKCDIFIVLASVASQKSQWVIHETGAAYGAHKRIIRYIIDLSVRDNIPETLGQIKHVTSFEEIVEYLHKEGDIGPQYGIPGEGIRSEEGIKRFLVVGQCCWDTIITDANERYAHTGGSAYYVSRAMVYAAKHLQSRVAVDVCGHLGEDRAVPIRNSFQCPAIGLHFTPGTKTLHFENRLVDKEDYARVEQVIKCMADKAISESFLGEQLVQRLKQESYEMALLLPLTPRDFGDLAGGFVPFLRTTCPSLKIGLELHGLTRQVSSYGGPVGNEVSEVLLHLLQGGVIHCAHCTIDEGLLVVKALAECDGVRCPVNESSTGDEIALALCDKGNVDYVGLTDGGRGSWVAWRKDDASVSVQAIKTLDLSKLLERPHPTGAGDTWFGIFAYARFGLNLPPIVAGVLATGFATIKCGQKGALGE